MNAYYNADSKESFERLADFVNLAGWKTKILSAEHSEVGKQAKIEWCVNNLGLSKSNINIVQRKEIKIRYANPEAILIDDKSDTVNSFIYAGGTGILYDSADSFAQEIDFLSEAIQTAKEENENFDSNDASHVLRARLSHILRKIDAENVETNLYACFFSAFYDINNYYDEISESLEVPEKYAELSDKYSSIKCLYSDFEDYLQSKKDEKNGAAVEKTKLLSLPEDNFSILLREFHSKIETDEFSSKRNLFGKVLFQFRKSHDGFSVLKLFPDEAKSLFMFVYLNLLVNFLQTNQELAVL